MTVTPTNRVRYFDHQHLRLPEFSDEQAYHIVMRRLHNISHHSWGIVLGLEIALEEGVPVVRPGLAVDGYGRELVLIDRRPMPPDLFERLGTTRLDVWLEYRLAETGKAGEKDCDPGGEQAFRQAEMAAVTFAVATGGSVIASRPPGVPDVVLNDPLPLETPDDPRRRWPVYLGRVVFDRTVPEAERFLIEASDRIYAGLTAQVIDHPGNAVRVELGGTGLRDEARRVGELEFVYQGEASRQFAVFVPPVPAVPAGATAPPPLLPRLGIYQEQTVIRGDTEIHGDLLLDGTAIRFEEAAAMPPEDLPAIYSVDDTLRIDLGDPALAAKSLEIGLFDESGTFKVALSVQASATRPLVTVTGDLTLNGLVQCTDVKFRTLSQEAVDLLRAAYQGGVAAGSVP